MFFGKIIHMKHKRLFTLLPIFTLLAGGLFAMSANKETTNTFASEVNPYPSSGRSGELMFVNGRGTYFRSGEADLVVYCFNSDSDYAWSDKCTFRVTGDTIRVMIPYKDGQKKNWSRFKVIRYNPSMDPATNGKDGIYNQSEALYFSSFYQKQNTVSVSGYGEGNLITIDSLKSYTTYYGIQSDSHMYLDLTECTGWENDGAKFAIYFFNPDRTNESAWSLSNSADGGYHSSFCWKVNGQDKGQVNDHLYECIVPTIDGNSVWQGAIAVRFASNASAPGWENVWNQTNNLYFDNVNNNATMIHVSDFGSGYLDNEHIISREDRVKFYGQYFLDTVSCSGSGDTDATTSAMWNTVKDEYKNHLSTTFQGEVWKASADKDGTAVQQAMARYDYIVFYKKYNHEDFINRQDSPNKTEYANSIIDYGMFDDSNNNLIVILVSILSVTLLSTISLLILKKKKHK